MLEALYGRLLFADQATLHDYLDGRAARVDAPLLRRRLFVMERSLQPGYPDHFFKNVRAHRFDAYQDVGQLLDGSLEGLARTFLSRAGDRLAIPLNDLPGWQLLLPRISPLVVVSRGLLAFCGSPGATHAEREAYVRRFILPQVRASALPTVDCSALDDFIRQEGLRDLHIHLNGSTEVDHLWMDILLRPKDFADALLSKAPREVVMEQYAQIDAELTPQGVVDRIRVARRLRMALVAELFGHGRPYDGGLTALACLDAPQETRVEDLYRLDIHPLRNFLGLGPDVNDLACEALWLVLAFEHLRQPGRGQFAKAFHAYLLLLGSLIPLCVQQIEQFGFDQFQKFTLNEVREMSEKTYKTRFGQLDYSAAGDLALIEGRIAPKTDGDKMAGLLESIFRGFDAFHGAGNTPYDMTVDKEVPLRTRLDLRLIAHFIKQDQLARHHEQPERLYRFEALRLEHEKALRVLLELKERYPGVAHYLTGLDAAANELHTPPEAFAPLFRLARKKGFRRFTYHAGEDFEHLLSGIRAVFEAITLLDLQAGDRIGHGTAVGVQPRMWLERTSARIVKRRGDWLDDLVFAHEHLLGLSTAAQTIHRLRREIERLSREVYGAQYAPSLLWEAMQLRKHNPAATLAPHLEPLDILDDDRQADLLWTRRIQSQQPAAFSLFEAYHGQAVVAASRATEEVETGILSDEELFWLQEVVLAEIVKRQLVIETLPTSNVRISVYDTIPEHHLFRWLGIRGEGHKPNVVVGTDDPGIFATNLRNEYAHLLHALRTEFDRDEQTALGILRQLRDAARIYGFTSA